MHISSTYYLSVKNGFLNGRGNEDTGNGTITRVKTYQSDGRSYPYVSAQSLRKWLRTTVNHLTEDYSYYDRVTKSDPTKKDMKNPEGLWIDPITYIEDDLFGYSHPFYNQPDHEDKRHLNVTFSNRLSPLQSTALISMPTTASLNEHDGWVNPGLDSSLPFNTEMMSGIFQASATLDLNRVGVFRSYGDIVELDPFYKKYYLEKGRIEERSQEDMVEVVLSDLKKRRLKALSLYFESILNLYGAAKSTILATDLSPRIIISAVLNSANNLFHDIVSATEQGEPYIDTELLLERLDRRATTVSSNIYIGYRSGTFSRRREEELMELDKVPIANQSPYRIIICSPGEVPEQIIDQVEGQL